MNKEDFRILKELCGLHQKKKDLEGDIAEERTRITKIENLRADAQNTIEHTSKNLDATSQSLIVTENKVEHLGRQILQGEQALSNATSEKQVESSERQLLAHKEEQKELEESAFELMERIEAFQSEISDKKEFLLGSEKTLIEIKAEVAAHTAPIAAEVEVLRSRVANLKSELPDLAATRIEKLIEKDLKHGPLTKIQDGSCFICRFTVNATDKDRIEKLLNLTACSSCYRIFIPNSTLY